MKKEENQKQENKKQEKNGKAKFLEWMDMPTELLQNTFRLTMVGNQSLLVEKYQSILEYDENNIRFSCGLTLQGTELTIEEINDHEIFITGRLMNMEME